MVGDRHRDAAGEFELAFLEQQGQVFHDVIDGDFQSQLRVKPFEGVIAVGAGGDDGLGAGILPGVDIALGIFG